MSWTNTSQKLPTKEGDYLVAISIYGKIIYDMVSWSNNLYKTYEWDFPKEQYNHSGFYGCDSEWGYCEILNVVAWMEIPEYKIEE